MTTDPADGDHDLVPGVVATLTPRVRRILAPNPGFMTGPGTNTYLVGHEEVAVIDPGPDDGGHVDAIVEAGDGRIRWVLCTHTHIDHWPAAVEVARRTGAEVLAHGSRDGLEVDRPLADADVVAGPGFTLRAIHTPGHASNHLCFLLEEEGVLFTGDHIMQGSTVVISPPDGDMVAYLGSLDRLRSVEPAIVRLAPAHGHLIDDPTGTIDGYVAHRLEREAKVADALAAAGRPLTVDELLPSVYDDVHELLHPVARRSLWAHLRKLVEDGRVSATGCDDVDNATWAAASQQG